jgi:glucose/arabinose dehydrogenase
MLSARGRLFLLLVFALLCAGCGGGGGGAAGPTIGITEPPVQPPPPSGTGTLAVNIILPSGVQGAVQVTGPGNVKRDVVYTSTLADLAPGNYVVTATAVAVGLATYVPTPVTQTVAVAAGSTATATVSYATSAVSLGLTAVASGLDQPIYLGAPDGDARQFIVLRGGRIVILQDGKLLPQPLLDITANVSSAGEGGLLSLAFDPQFNTNGFFYIYYTDLQQNIVVERIHANANSADPASRLVILRIPHAQFNNHYGGQLAFGPEGYLYLGTGDGGGEGDPLNNGRNLNSLLAKVLRVDVSHASASQPYAIPASNPFVGQAGKRPETWASGLRNPWRFSFDGAALYIADVGQGMREEVDIGNATNGGLDYGWNTMEGTQCVKTGCDRTGLALPALEYTHVSGTNGACAIVGGFVYRGAAIPELAGRYFYSDYCAGFVKSVYAAGGSVIEQRDWGLPSVGQVVSLGRDGQGELYVIAASGSIYKIGRTTAPKD